MFFNSVEFGIFLPIVFIIYWFVTNRWLKVQNLFVLTASYFFYGWWDWRFLSLLFISSSVDYLVGLRLANEMDGRRRGLLLFASLAVNLGFLGYFKYCNFFIESFSQAFTFLGHAVHPSRLNVVLPVGISFYTFQTLSYSIDVYRRKLEPTKDAVAFFAFISFFPQLVAGPIERATHLLPQFFQKRHFEYAKAVDGMRQILWGLFKKVVIADNCANYVDQIFSGYDALPGSTLAIGALLFAFQIYGDFSGYSDIAIGTSRLLGFSLMKNFAFPYFSRDVAEFWRRWHISLTTWFRDYIYIPLGGSRGGHWKRFRNITIIFAVSGLWHGSKWTFVVWGLMHAVCYLPLVFLEKNRNHLEIASQGRLLPTWGDGIQIVTTFLLVTISWIFFRSETLQDAIKYVYILFSPSLFTVPSIAPKSLLLLIAMFIGIEWFGREGDYAIARFMDRRRWPGRWATYYAVSFMIVYFSENQQEFIYFQF